MTTPFYRRKGVLIVAGLLAIPVIALGWWLAAPLFQDDIVDEAFPIAAPVEAETPEAEVVPEEPMDDMAGDEAMEDDEMSEDHMDEDEEEMADEPTGPVAVLTAEVMGADAAHEGTGTATVYRLEDGSHVLRFEDFEVTNGPDLHVFLTPVTEVQSDSDVMADGYLDLGELKGNIGDQNYELPADFDVESIGSVVIYCVPFSVVFATASLG
jgi:hypothetical protein